MPESKSCDVCGSKFVKPASCSRTCWTKRRFCSLACKGRSQRGKPSNASGRTFDRPKHLIPCRICGEPTTYHDTALAGKIRCQRPECVTASRQIKNERISARALEMYASGERAKARHAWVGVSRVSREESLMRPWFESQGWVPQYRVLTGVHTNKLPRQFHLDFALPDRRLYVEIDGDVHRLRQDRDARRDAMLAERGWTGLRLPSSLVQSDLDAAIHRVTSWLLDQSSYPS